MTCAVCSFVLPAISVLKWKVRVQMAKKPSETELAATPTWRHSGINTYCTSLFQNVWLLSIANST